MKQLDQGEMYLRSQTVDLLVDLGPTAKPAIPALVAVLGWSEATDGADEDLGAECARLGLLFRAALRAKRTAAAALGRFGSAAAAAKPALATLADHKDARLRYRAANALRRIG